MTGVPNMPRDVDKTPEDWARAEQFSAIDQQAFDDHWHKAQKYLQARRGGEFSSRDMHKWCQGYAAALSDLHGGSE